MIVYCLLTLIVTGVWKYLPTQMTLLQERMVYYFFGHEAKGVVSVHRLVSGWVGRNVTHEL